MEKHESMAFPSVYKTYRFLILLVIFHKALLIVLLSHCLLIKIKQSFIFVLVRNRCCLEGADG